MFDIFLGCRRQSILVSKNHTLLHSVDARPGGRAPLRWLRPVLRPVQRVRQRRRVQPPLRRLRAARAAHEPQAMIDSQCNVHTAICVQYRVGSPDWIRQRNTDIEEHEIRYQSTKASISYTNIEGEFVEIDKSSISVYNDFEVLNFDVSSISFCVDIEISGFNIEDSSISISYCFDVDRYRRFLELRHSISNVKTSGFDIESSYRT
jgi:hypothetical protein